MAAINLELFFRKNEKNLCGEVYFEFKPKANASTEQKIKNTPEQTKDEPEPISSTEENEVAKSLSNFPIVDVKDYDIAEKTIHYIHVNHVIEKPEMKGTEAEEIFEER